MNSTAKATEIRLSAPTIMRPTAAVIANPTARLIETARMMRYDFSASHRMSSTTPSVTAPLRKAPSLSVPNSSSAIGTGPVSRTVAPYWWAKSRLATAWRTASVAFSPGCSAWKSSTGLMVTMRRSCDAVAGSPPIIAYHENRAGSPLSACSIVSDDMLSGRARASSVTCPACTPVSASDIPCTRPRRLGSEASWPNSGAARESWPVTPATCSVGRKRNWLRAMKSLDATDSTASNSFLSGPSRPTNRSAAAVASSGVGASTTATISRVPWVKTCS